jgi:hypothetical protein
VAVITTGKRKFRLRRFVTAILLQAPESNVLECPLAASYYSSPKPLNLLLQVISPKCPRISDTPMVSFLTHLQQTQWPESASELHRPSDRLLSAKLVPFSADRGASCSQRGGSPTAVISVIDRSRYLFFQVAPQLYSRGWVDPVQTHFFSENLVAPGLDPDLWICSQELWPLDNRAVSHPSSQSIILVCTVTHVLCKPL